MGRKAIGIELKESYFKQSILNLQSLEELQKIDKESTDLFGNLI
jgi:hypothetical protein